MIDARPSLDAAKGISGPLMGRYLRSAGWDARPSRVSGVTIFSLDIPGADGPIQIVLPESPGFGDELRRVADALRTVEGVEERPLLEIADDIKHGISSPDMIGVEGETTKAP